MAMIPILPSAHPLRFEMRWIIAFLLVILASSTAFAHPIDPACLADATASPTACQELHDKGNKVTISDAMERLEAAQSKFPTRAAASFVDTIKRFLGLGFVHILPKGLDHILFVLALFLGARTWQQLLMQVSAFTVAHSVTLGLAAIGAIHVSASIVEPLIALSIAFLALENLVFKSLQPWRIFVVFGFGLFHGLGFAGVLSELGLDQSHFLTSLISFNIGVEGGQLTVIALAALPALWLRRTLNANHVPHLYDTILVRPASVLIGLAGLWWAFERVFLGG